MRLSEKIYRCRKKAGMSQEELAARLGVSRQAVSKWETGESEPEIGKLKALSGVFHVTVDELLSEEPLPEETAEEKSVQPAAGSAAENGGETEEKNACPAWLEHMPGFVGRMFRRYGWLYGLRVALGGAGTVLFGILVRVMGHFGQQGFDQMDSDFGGLNTMMGASTGEWTIDAAGNLVQRAAASGSSFGPGALFGAVGNICIFVGVCVVAAGLWLAWYLKKKGAENEKGA